MPHMNLRITKEQEKMLNQEFEGTEWCPHCNMETDYKFNPMKDKNIVCEHCKTEIKPCSLCDSGKICDDCEDRIKASLLHFNGLWNNEVNGKY